MPASYVDGPEIKLRIWHILLWLLAHLSRRLVGKLIVYWSSRRSSVRVSVRLFTLSNIYISKTSKPNATKFYLQHHWGEGKAASAFGPDWIRTLVSMATDSCQWLIGELIVYPWSGVRFPSSSSSTMLKHLLLRNHLAD